MADEIQVDPKQLLFTLRTICDELPAVDETSPPEGAMRLHEDDWREIEFVASVNRDYIDQQLAALAVFDQQHRAKCGWTEVYVRKEHPSPLAAAGIHLDDEQPLAMSALTISEPKRTVRGGFALSDGSGWFVYGQRAPDGLVVQMGVAASASAMSRDFASQLSHFATAAHLMLVDWYRNVIVDTTTTDAVLRWANRNP
jgi:hypothetical protein